MVMCRVLVRVRNQYIQYCPGSRIRLPIAGYACGCRISGIPRVQHTVERVQSMVWRCVLCVESRCSLGPIHTLIRAPGLGRIPDMLLPGYPVEREFHRRVCTLMSITGSVTREHNNTYKNSNFFNFHIM